MKFSDIYRNRSNNWLWYLLIVLLSLTIIFLLSPNISWINKQFEIGQVINNDIVVDNEIVIKDELSYNQQVETISQQIGLFFSYDKEIEPYIIDNLTSSLNAYFDNQQEINKLKLNFLRNNQAIIISQINKLEPSLNDQNTIKKLKLFNQLKNTSSNTSQLFIFNLFDESINKLNTLSKSDNITQNLNNKISIIKNRTEENLDVLIKNLNLNDDFNKQSLKQLLSTDLIITELISTLSHLYQEPFIDSSIHLEYPPLTTVNIIDEDQTIRTIGVLNNFDNIESRIAKLTTTQTFSTNEINFIIKISKPNLVLNEQITKYELDKAIAELSEQRLFLSPGMILAQKGEVITKEKKMVLDNYFKENTNLSKLPRIIGIAIAVLLSFIAFFLVIRSKIPSHEFNRYKKKWILLSLSLLIAQFLCIKIIYLITSSFFTNFSSYLNQSLILLLPVALAAIMASALMHKETAAPLGICSAIFVSFMFPNQSNNLMFSIVSCLLAISLINHKNIDSRSSILILGIKLSIINGLIILALGVINIPMIKLEFNYGALLIAMLFGVIGAQITAVTTLILLPLFEIIFDTKTNIRLLELSTINHPVLKELMEKAPGSYYHSIAVGSLAEAGALKIGANPLFCRIASYFHDIGKIYHSEYFIENMDSSTKNSHFTIDDPIISKNVILGHVSNGIMLAKQHNLGQELIDIIQEHHGTTLVRYFYQQALIKSENNKHLKNTIFENDFRYPGPKPQSPNSALIMLADICEAAIRSMKNPNPNKIKEVVKIVSQHVLDDRQLDDSQINLRDFKAIQDIYIEILSALYHSRIEYPKLTKDVKHITSLNKLPNQPITQ